MPRTWGSDALPSLLFVISKILFKEFPVRYREFCTGHKSRIWSMLAQYGGDNASTKRSATERSK